MLASTALPSWSASRYGLHEEKELYEYVLGNGSVQISIISLGAAITAIRTPDRKGGVNNIVAAFADKDEYWHNTYYLGCIVGRYANRIGGGRLVLDGRPVQLSVNNQGNHLHGGFVGFQCKIWDLQSKICTAEEAGVVLEYDSPDGEEGYPGNLRVQVSYLLDKAGRLTITYKAYTDKPTPVNLTNHSYFNLSGFDDPVIDEHELVVNAKTYTEKNTLNLPTGRLLPVSGTPMDFSTPRRIGEALSLLPFDNGLDHNYVLTGTAPASQPAAHPPLTSAARLYDPGSGRIVNVLTDQPGIQIYTANWWDGSVTGQQGSRYIRHGAVALETQAFPDSPNHPAFPDTILRPGALYQTSTIFEFKTT